MTDGDTTRDRPEEKATPAGAPDSAVPGERQSEEEIREERLAVTCCRFFSAGEEFYIPIEDLVEIAEPTAVTPVPLAPDYVLGVINLRGVVVPLVDLGRIRKREPATGTERRMVVAEAGTDLLAFVADGMPDLSPERIGEEIDVREFLARYRVKID